MKVLLLFGFLLFITACSSLGANECETDDCYKQRAYDTVIAKHDEVMPLLAQISNLKEQIELKMNNQIDSLTIEKYHRLLIDLDAADEAMWVWMRAFDSDLEELTVEEALTYLAQEEAKIDSVGTKIREAMARAEERLAD